MAKTPGDNSGWSVALNDEGLIVAIGARGNDNDNGNNSGHVRVYQYEYNIFLLKYEWVQIGQDIDGKAA